MSWIIGKHVCYEFLCLCKINDEKVLTVLYYMIKKCGSNILLFFWHYCSIDRILKIKKKTQKYKLRMLY